MRSLKYQFRLIRAGLIQTGRRRLASARRLAGLLVMLFVVAGCASKMILYPRDGGDLVIGAITFSGVMNVTLDGRDYHGNFVPTDGGVATGTYNSYGRRFRYGTYQSYTPPRNARALLVAADGNTLRCEFTFGGEGGIGSCTTNDREEYDLLIRTE